MPFNGKCQFAEPIRKGCQLGTRRSVVERPLNRNRASRAPAIGCDTYVSMLRSACELDCVVDDRSGEDLLRTIAPLAGNDLVPAPSAIAVDDATCLPSTFAARGY